MGAAVHMLHVYTCILYVGSLYHVHVHVQCIVNLGTCFIIISRHVVLDEADQMLERGFADSVEEILAASFNDKESKYKGASNCV